MAQNEITVTILFYIIITNIIYSFFDFDYDFENSIAYEINQFVNEKLIYSFIPKNKCDSNEEALKLGKWKGLKAGCSCPLKGLTVGKCTLKQKHTYFCRDKPEVPAKYYTKFDSKKICVKRTKETYKDFLLKKQIIEKNEKCQEGYKCCGIIDTLNRKLCMKLNEKCPITINDINSPDKNNTENSQILSIFKITETEPCMNPNQKNWQNFHKLEYPVQRCKKVNNYFYDFRYEKLENFVTNQFDLYENNGIIHNYHSDSFSELANVKLYLWGRNFIGLNIEDIKEFSLDDLIYYETVSNKHYSFIWLISLLALISLIGCFLEAHSYQFNRIFQRGKAPLYLMITFVCIIILFVLNLIIFIYNLKIQNILIVEGNDDYTKGNMRLFKREIRTRFYFNLSSLIFVLILIILIIFIIFKNIREYN